MEIQIKSSLPRVKDNPILITGPCSAESEEQVMQTAYALVAHGCHIFRAGVWKPRTKPGGFEGFGEKAIPWLARVKKETGMAIATEVALPEHVEASVLGGVDIVWIGARTTSNPFAVQAIADALRGTNLPVLVKNPVNPDLELWIGAIERLYKAGIPNITAVHRGFSTYDSGEYRNLPMWQIPIELKRRIPSISILCDPSHMGGKRELVAPICQMSEDMGFDGYMIESHINPQYALTDAKQQLTPDELFDMFQYIHHKKSIGFGLEEKRAQIDGIDAEIIHLLSSRMRISQEIGKIKRHQNVTIFQQKRYSEIIKKWEVLGRKFGMDEAFVKSVFRLLHEESVNEQTKIKQ